MKALNVARFGIARSGLYIPHGSDESSLYRKLFQTHVTFISHMVQMKEQLINSFQSINLALYPTWFRWKGLNRRRASLFSMLYIPHGSDESFVTRYGSAGSSVFISHMVQMKVLRDKNWPTLEPALYPTWFRWKFLEIRIDRH